MQRTTRNHPSARGLVRPAAMLAAVVAVLVALAAPAWAHVEADGATAATGLTTITFSFTHGCTGSPTTGLRIQLPAGTTEVKPENPTGWVSAVTDTELSWSGGSIPDTDKGSFSVAMRVAGTKGDTVFFPTIQVCAQGQESWIEKTTDPEAENAAPRIVLSGTVAADTTVTTGEATASTTAKATTTTVADPTTTPDTQNNIGALVGGIAVAIIVIGALILYLRNRKPKGPAPTASPGAESSAAPDGPTGPEAS